MSGGPRIALNRGEQPPSKSLHEARQGTGEPGRRGAGVMALRQRLQNRRQCESFRFLHSGVEFTGSVGFYEDGRIAEVFTSCDRTTSPIEAISRDAAVTVSIALQFGANLKTIRAALTRDHDGGPATLLGAALDALAEAP